MSSITISRVREIVLEEIIKHQRKVLKEAKEEQPKQSHEISAAANELKTAIKKFNDEDLPEVPTELQTALKVAETVLTNMSDNPGRYRGGQDVDTSVENQ